MSDYESFTVAELKEKLKAYKLPVGGKKSDLITRLEEYEEEHGAEEDDDEEEEEEDAKIKKGGKKRKADDDASDESPPTKKPKKSGNSALSAITSSTILPSLTLIREQLGAGRYVESFWKAYGYFYGGKVAHVKAELDPKKGLIVSGTCKGSEKTPYDISVTIKQEEGAEGHWSGSCTCEQSSVKKKIKPKDDSLVDTMTSSQKKKFNEIKKELSGNSVDQLKSMLKFNNMKVTGAKAELIERVAEGKVLGVAGKCSSCGGGRPKFERGFWVCPGFMDDDEFQNCNFVDTEIERKPWEDEK